MKKLWMALGVCLMAGTLMRADEQTSDAQTSEDRAYEEGTKAMNQQRWPDAERAFRNAVRARGKRTDAALYWQAYVQKKQGRQSQAFQTCESLDAEYPQSKWRGECDALSVEMVSVDMRKASNLAASADRDPAGNPDEDIKTLALNGLMQQAPERALPIVKSILLSPTQSNHLKERALFVLAQSQSKEAQEVLDQIARGKMDPDLQVKAIHMMAAMKGEQAAGFLNDIYKNSHEERVKEAALEGMFISNDSKDMIAIARAESDPQMRRKIVGRLSLMHGKDVTDYMTEILSK